MRIGLVLSMGCALSALVAPSMAYAQQAATDAAAEDFSDQAIVVTAQRRAQAVQDVPLAVTAIGSDALENEGVRDITNLGDLAPSLSITSGGGTPQVFMRGIGSTNTNANGDGAVAVHVDGVYLARANALNAQFYDLARVEVVRGPQGTLYGRNATAGAINIITNQPRFTFEGAASVEYGNYNTLVTSGMVNAPVTDKIAVRAAFQTVRHDGYLRTAEGYAGNDRADQDDVSARLQVLLEPTDRLSIVARGDFTHMGGAGSAMNVFPLPTNDPYVTTAQRTVSRDNRIFGGSLELNYDLDFATVTYLGGYRELNLDIASENLTAGNNRLSYIDNKQKSSSHELRLAGDVSGLEWVVGAYLFDEKNIDDVNIGLPGDTFLTFRQNPIRANSFALFGQGTYSLTDDLRVTAGLRYTEDEKSNRGGTFLTLPDGSVITQIAINLADASWNSTDWKVGLEYDLGPDSLVYAQVATAYKAGGYFDGPAPNTYDPEEIVAYEIGSKNTFLGGDLVLNLSGFYNDYTNLQVSAVETIEGEAALVTRNAGGATIYGVELETHLRVLDNGAFSFVGSWLHAEYDDFVLELGDPFVNNDANANVRRCYAADYSQASPRRADFSGCRMARTPEWSFTTGYTHRFELGNGGAFEAQAQTRFESGKELEFHGFAENYQKSFTKTDLSLTYIAPSEDWRLQAYVRNLENKAVKTISNSDAGSGDSTIGTADYAPPRLYGLRFSATF